MNEYIVFFFYLQDGGWISDHIVDQYWQETATNLNHTETSESRNCSVAESWYDSPKVVIMGARLVGGLLSPVVPIIDRLNFHCSLGSGFLGSF